MMILPLKVMTFATGRGRCFISKIQTCDFLLILGYFPD